MLPVLVTLFLGMCEVGRGLNATISLQSAVAVAGRLASIGQATNDQVKQSVLANLKASDIPVTNAVVTVSNLTQPGIDVGAASTLDKIQVTVSVPFKDVKWGAAGIFMKDSTPVTATAMFFSARVNPYPTNISVPPGF